MKILVGISGASSVELGFCLLNALEKFTPKDDEIFAILSKGARVSFEAEMPSNSLILTLSKLKKTQFLDDDNLAASVSSGSFGINKTIIAPCSLNTLSKIKHGIADTLITRSAAVALKERKRLILGVREMPFSTLSLKQMFKLSKMGVIIAPPVFASYFQAQNLSDLQNFIVGKWLNLLEIEHNLYKKWGE